MLTQAPAGHISQTRSAMGTRAEVIVHGPDRAEALALCWAIIDDCERRWSRFLSDSELSQINVSAGNPTVVTEATFNLIVSARNAWLVTDGAFDPSMGAAIAAAGYDRTFDDLAKGPSTALPPEQVGELALGEFALGELALGEFPEPSQIVLNPEARTVQLPKGMALDFGGIAKGATVDLVTEALAGLEIDGSCVSIGGDLRVRGTAPSGGAWRVELDCPGAAPEQVRPALLLADGAVCTSATTKRSWIVGDVENHHLLDPSTRAPRQSGPLSASVVAKEAIAAEVLTKQLMAGASIEHFGATGLVVDQDGTIRHLAGLENYLEGGC